MTTMKELEFHPIANLFPLLEGDEFAELVGTIRKNGLKQKIIIHDGTILDGRNRYRACKEAGVEPEFEEWAPGGESPWDFVWDLNAARRHLDKGLKAVLAVKFLRGSEEWRSEHSKAIAEANEERSKKQKGQRKIKNVEGSAALVVQDDQKRERSKVAKRAGVSSRLVQDAISLEKKAPELFEQVTKGEIPLARAVTQVRRKERMKKIGEIAQGNKPLIAGPERFAVIYADPPWRYEHVKTENRAIENQYPTMSLDSVCAMPIDRIAARDCVLFLWATSPKLREAMQVLDSWCFTYRTCMVWVKNKIGMGYYFRQQHELLLVATKGSPPVPEPANRPSSVLEAPRNDHSSKPSEVYNFIESMYPEFPKIELFCRSPRDGWFVWGNQSNA